MYSEKRRGAIMVHFGKQEKRQPIQKVTIEYNKLRAIKKYLFDPITWV